MKIDADKLKRWTERQRNLFELLLRRTGKEYYDDHRRAYNQMLKKINRMVEAEQKKQEGK